MGATGKALPKDLLGFQELQRQVFDQHDRETYSLEDLLLKIFVLLGRLAKTIRKSDDGFDGGKPYLLSLFRWYISLCNRQGLDSAGVLWYKYPNICPYCLQKSCVCIGGIGQLALQVLPRYRLAYREPVAIGAWQEMFRRIYDDVDRQRGLVSAIARFLEEVAELVECLATGPIDAEAFKLEMADLGVWIFCLANLLGVDLETELLERYPGVCPNCKRESCSCPKNWLD